MTAHLSGVMGEQQHGLDHIARLAGQLSGTGLACVTTCERQEVISRGTVGLPPHTYKPKCSPSKELYMIVDNVDDYTFFANYPTVRADQGIRRAVWVPVRDDTGDLVGSIITFNPKFSSRRSRSMVISSLCDLASLARRDLLASLNNAAAPAAPGGPVSWTSGIQASVPSQFQEAPGTGPHDPLAEFLLSTLVKRVQLRSRNQVAFTVLRQWRKSIKRFQVDAFRAIKLRPSEQIVEGIACEMAAGVRRQFGQISNVSIVPVPCGHSGSDDCLSVRIAKRLADTLDATFHPAFERVPVFGSSHPKGSAKLRKFVFHDVPVSPVILVDDIATSGKHIEVAVMQLRSKCSVLGALAWLGGDASG